MVRADYDPVSLSPVVSPVDDTALSAHAPHRKVVSSVPRWVPEDPANISPAC